MPETADEAQLTLGSANPIPDSKLGLGKVQLAAKKLALRVGFSSELVEDAIVPVLNLYREQAVRAIADGIDYVLLNGDTNGAATGNINKDHAAPNATDRFMAFDGLRKLPLVTNTSNRVDANNVAPSLTLLRQTRFKMDNRYSARPSDLAWIVSAEMSLTEADGKVGAGPNDRGTALCVYRPGWVVGYRRRIAVSVDYIPDFDSYQLTATVRLALAGFDTEVAGVLFNLAI